MAPRSASSKFTQIYESLPKDAQQSFLEKELIALLDLVPKDKAKKVLTSSKRLKTRYSSLPTLDLKGKRKEISTLLDELYRDSNRAVSRDQSIREELLSEVVESLVDWLSDIWRVVYEYNLSYSLAHTCLLFCAEALEKLGNTPGRCKCSFMNMFVTVAIKKTCGKIVKSFSLTGAHNIDEALLWIWRDLFVSLLANGGKHDKKMIPEMLADIERVFGWGALERLLYGGKGSSVPFDDSDEEADFDEVEDESDFGEDDIDSEDEDNDRCTCAYHGSHWPKRYEAKRLKVRDLVCERLITTFRTMPSLCLFQSLIVISGEPEDTKANLLAILPSIATTCSETFTAALDIHSFERNSSNIVSLLDSNSHLLRPRDYPSLQLATMTLTNNPFFHQRGLQILEKELLDTARAIRAGLITSFSKVEDKAHKDELMRIIKLSPGSNGRQDRIRRWVDAVCSPGTTPPNPVAFAALMMGIPLPPGVDDTGDGDSLGYLDPDTTDPDLEDLLEEFRPKMKERFEAWTEIAMEIKRGPGVLLKVYTQLAELIPVLRAPDAIEEMIGRLADKPSKHHVCDALDALSSFGKLQRKKLTIRSDKKKRNGGGSSSSLRNQSNPFTFSFGPSSASSPSTASVPVAGGMEDVD